MCHAHVSCRKGDGNKHASHGGTADQSEGNKTLHTVRCEAQKVRQSVAARQIYTVRESIDPPMGRF